MAHEDEYTDSMLAAMDLIWGEGFMAPGGEGHVANMVEDLALRERRVMDLGCGQGRSSCLLAAQYGAHVVGTDLETQLVDRARERASAQGLGQKTEFHVVQPGPLDFPDDSYDLILISGALTQIEDKLGVYRECFRVLKPGGVLSCYDWMTPGGELSADMHY